MNTRSSPIYVFPQFTTRSPRKKEISENLVRYIQDNVPGEWVSRHKCLAHMYTDTDGRRQGKLLVKANMTFQNINKIVNTYEEIDSEEQFGVLLTRFNYRKNRWDIRYNPSPLIKGSDND